MSDDMVAYVVRQGDYLVKLAWMHGFDAEEVWKHEKNKALADLRKDHHILAPGDVLFIPVRKKEGLPIQKGVTNKYVAKVPKVAVRVRFLEAGVPLGNERYEILGTGQTLSGQSREDGEVSFEVAVTTREATISFPDRNTSYHLRIGNLDPPESQSGTLSRLANLGYLSSPAPNLREAISETVKLFQQNHEIDPTGTFDSGTILALRDAHTR
jgi:hypothetical protein